MWYSKDDVLKDLAECTGIPISDVDDDYLVRGSRPPPPLKFKEIDDEEYNLRFGGCGDQLPSASGPDLEGITKMLRMVDTFNRPQERYVPPISSRTSPRIEKASKGTIVISKPTETSPKTKPPRPINFENQTVVKSKPTETPPKIKPPSPINAESQTVLKSKLNPNVSEFVPKFLFNENTSTNNNVSENGKEITNHVMDPKAAIISNHGIEPKAIIETNDHAVINKDGIIASNSVCKEETEKQKMVALLKSKISATCKENTVENKREKNVAMAALLRLNSGLPVTSPNSTSSSSKPPLSESNNEDKIGTPLVLFTPDYFAGPSCSPKLVNVDDSEHNIPEPKPPLKTPSKTPSPQQLNDPQIKESIDKVNNWLNSPQKKAKACNLHIGPVTFKRKETNSPQSRSTEASKTIEPLHVIPSFVPSRYASELAKDLESRVKAKEEKDAKSQPPLDMWTKLEMDLKAKDKVVLERLRQAQNESNPQSSGSSSSLSQQ